MKELILYWTLGGTTKKYAERYALAHAADIAEIKEKKKRSMLGAWCPGIIQAAKASSPAIEEPGINLEAYDSFVLAAPVWASNPAPAINSAARLLPPGKEVKIVLISKGGESNDAIKLKERLIAADLKVTGVENIKASEI